jgi:hypothetical protein
MVRVVAKAGLALVLVAVLGREARADLDVVFLLDTTGSMSGEIQEAKDRILQIASALREARKGERLRLGAVAYRDRGDVYLTQKSALDPDPEHTLAFLAGLTADGGGDAPEDVLSGLRVALDELDWNLAAGVERQIFLVGDAPPHFDYPDRPKPEALIARARSKGIVINGIGCRSLPPEGVAFFRRVSFETEGQYQHIGRVQLAEPGLARAVLHTLARAPSPDAAAARQPVSVRALGFDASRPSRGGIVVHQVAGGAGAGAGGAAAGGCRLVVALPPGLGLERAPDVRRDATSLHVGLAVTQAAGGTSTFGLDSCAPLSTPIHVSIGGK